MPPIPGTNVGAPVVPYDTLDTYPSHEALYGLGGLRTVATTVARNAIPVQRLEIGCEAYVLATNTTYRLKNTWPGGIPPVDADWEVAVGPGGGGAITGTGNATSVAYWTSATNLAANVFFRFADPATPGTWLVVDPALVSLGGTFNFGISGNVSVNLPADDIAGVLLGTVGRSTLNGTHAAQQIVGIGGQGINNSSATTFLIAGGFLQGSTSAGTVSNLAGAVIGFDTSGASIITNAAGITIQNDIGGGSTVGSCSGIAISANSSAIPTNKYGIVIQDQINATNNWSIFTGRGLVEFGDDLRSHARVAIGNNATFGVVAGVDKLWDFEQSITDVTSADVFRYFQVSNVINPNADSSLKSFSNFYSEINGNGVQNYGNIVAGEFHANAGGPVNFNSVQGIYSQAISSGNGTVNNSAGLRVLGGVANAGTLIQNNYGIVVNTQANPGSITGNFGMAIMSPTVGGGGVIATNYGLFIQDQGAAAAQTWAIYTQSGKVEFGDDVQGHARCAFGNIGAYGLNPPVDRIWDFGWSQTDFSANSTWTGQTVRYLINPSADASANSIIASSIVADIIPGTAQNVGAIFGQLLQSINNGSGTLRSLVGLDIQTIHAGSALVNNAAGISVSCYSNSTGDITQNVGAYFQSGANNAASTINGDTTVKIDTPRHTGTLNNHIGLYIADQNFGPNAYAIATAGGNCYFSGKSGFGGTGGLIPNSAISIDGALSVKRTQTSFNYNVLANDFYIGCQFLGGAITITLPVILSTDVGQGKIYVISDEDINASVNNIFIVPGGGDIILDGPTAITTNGGVIWLQSVSNSTWKII